MPQILFISCTEARIAPQRFVSHPDQLFEMRNIGNIVPPYNPKVISGEIATIEYALSLPHLSEVVISGHSSCGAVAALLDNNFKSVSPSVRRWLVVGSSRAASRDAMGKPTDRPTMQAFDRAARAHLLTQLAHLAGYPGLESGRSNGRLRLRALFHVGETGSTELYSPREDRFIPLSREGGRAGR
ncbi:carbonate dehydratase [Streptomyces albus]|uniref:carbonic anhydrase n=1 Tax=Streptomyces albus (strain ATCC 21838 / DSM 41398 / FERM P-419 / JCM 4703 / NBRC 107858) TaxID=1081613 RepID=A0A0B5FA87_STRA4|nr:carbonate dehydratase [Streptomyces albus]AOU81680.1 carbonate dehydratase [Streptomyces albus]